MVKKKYLYIAVLVIALLVILYFTLIPKKVSADESALWMYRVSLFKTKISESKKYLVIKEGTDKLYFKLIHDKETKKNRIQIWHCDENNKLLDTYFLNHTDFIYTDKLETIQWFDNERIFITGRNDDNLALGVMVTFPQKTVECYLGSDFQWDSQKKYLIYFVYPPESTTEELPQTQMVVNGVEFCKIPTTRINLFWSPDEKYFMAIYNKINCFPETMLMDIGKNTTKTWTLAFDVTAVEELLPQWGEAGKYVTVGKQSFKIDEDLGK